MKYDPKTKKKQWKIKVFTVLAPGGRVFGSSRVVGIAIRGIPLKKPPPLKKNLHLIRGGGS